MADVASTDLVSSADLGSRGIAGAAFVGQVALLLHDNDDAIA